MAGSPNRVRIDERRSATVREILSAAWDGAAELGLAGLTLRAVAARVGMRPPSLYGYFASKNALYSTMFEQAWLDCQTAMERVAAGAPTEPRARLLAAAQAYFDFSVADVPRYQLMNVNAVPGFRPEPQAYAAAQRTYAFMLEQLPLRDPGRTGDTADADVYTALLAGLISQQLANEPGGVRWRRQLPRVIAMFADDLGLPRADTAQEAP